MPDGVKGADDDMESKPSGEKPACPVVAEEEEDAAHDGQKAEQKNQRLKRTVGKVIDDADKAREDEQDREDPDGDRARFHVGGKL